LPVQADVANVAECSRLFDAAVNAYGGLDILVANAGVQRDAPFGKMTIEEWRAVIGRKPYGPVSLRAGGN
jgi:glucose 1-dehydrogenase